jgi:radical SAM protein with 4Fe4S-binding SPASM domain
MSEKEVDLCIDELDRAGCWSVTLTGGEPLILGKKFFSYADKFRKVFERVIVTTNGTLVDKYDPGLFTMFDLVQISVDGPEKIHNNIRGNNVFEKTVENLLSLKRNGVKVAVMMTLNKINHSYFLETFNFFKDLGVIMYYERYTPAHNKDLELTPRQYKKVLETAKRNKISSSDPILRSYCFDNLSSVKTKNRIVGGCSAGISGIAISSNLDVFPCVRMRIVLGNLKKNHLLKIWSNNDILNQLRDTALLKGRCGSCIFVESCRGCRADAYLEGDLLKEDKLCPINKPKRKGVRKYD